MIPMERITAEERQLLKVFRALDMSQRGTLVAFARFLATDDAEVQGAGDASASASLPQRPREEPRPEQETVIGAIKRLRRVYPMLDAGEMLQETSSLMASHVLQGREAEAVIDELEGLFAARYAALTQKADETSGAAP